MTKITIKIVLLFYILQLQAMAVNLNDFKKLNIMTFNILHNNGNGTLDERSKKAVKLIVQNRVDILGVQELSNTAYRDFEFKNLVNSYNYSRIGGAINTTNCIFIKNSTLSSIESGSFFYDKKHNPRNDNRSVTWAILQQKNSSNKYFVMNTHLIHNNKRNRLLQIEELKDKIKDLNKDNYPVIILGDMNFDKNEETTKENEENAIKPYDILLSKEGNKGKERYYFDPYTGSAGTTRSNKRRIDYIILDQRLKINGQKEVIIKTDYNHPYNIKNKDINLIPSDHFPVLLTGTIFKSPKIASQKFNEAETKIYFADLNNDGCDDLITWNKDLYNGNTLTYLSNCNGTFKEPDLNSGGHGSKSSNTKFYFADVNGDGCSDKIYWNRYYHPKGDSKKGKTVVSLSKCNGKFKKGVANSNGTSTQADTVFFFPQLDKNDHCADKVFWRHNYHNGFLQIYKSKCNGHFSWHHQSDIFSDSKNTKFDFADVNGDGYNDLIRWNPNENEGKTLIYLSLADSESTVFANDPIVHHSGSSTINTTKMYYADIDGDGCADKIWWRNNFNNGYQKVYYGQKNGNFSRTPVDIKFGYSKSNATSFFFPHINKDKKADKIYWNKSYKGGIVKSYLAK